MSQYGGLDASRAPHRAAGAADGAAFGGARRLPVGHALLLNANALLPSLVIWYYLNVRHTALWAALTFNAVCLVLMPAACLAARPGKAAEYAGVVRAALAPWRRQLPQAAIAWAASCAATTGGYYALRRVVPNVTDIVGQDGLLGFSLAGKWCIGIYFSTVNPVLEELFWRVYLHRELGAMCDGGAPAPPLSELQALAHGLLSDDDAAWGRLPHTSLLAEPRPTDEATGLLLGGGAAPAARRPRSEWSKALASAYYAAYHGVVVSTFVPPLWIGLTVGFLFCMGRVMVWCREDPGRGLLTAIGMHAGLDASLGFILWMMYHAQVVG